MSILLVNRKGVVLIIGFMMSWVVLVDIVNVFVFNEEDIFVFKLIIVSNLMGFFI